MKATHPTGKPMNKENTYGYLMKPFHAPEYIVQSLHDMQIICEVASSLLLVWHFLDCLIDLTATRSRLVVKYFPLQYLFRHFFEISFEILKGITDSLLLLFFLLVGFSFI